MRQQQHAVTQRCKWHTLSVEPVLSPQNMGLGIIVLVKTGRPHASDQAVLTQIQVAHSVPSLMFQSPYLLHPQRFDAAQRPVAPGRQVEGAPAVHRRQGVSMHSLQTKPPTYLQPQTGQDALEATCGKFDGPRAHNQLMAMCALRVLLLVLLPIESEACGAPASQ